MYQIFSGLSLKVLMNPANISKMVPSRFTGETNLLLTAHQVVKHKTNGFCFFCRSYSLSAIGYVGNVKFFYKMI